MTKNPVLEELRQTRERLLAQAGGTIEGLVAQLQEDERQSNRTFIEPKKRAKIAPAPIETSDTTSAQASQTMNQAG